MFPSFKRSGWAGCIGLALALSSGSAALAEQFTISTVAGGGPPATPAAALNAPIGPVRRITMDAAGNLYFSTGNMVFKADTTGVLTRVAGSTLAGYSGDGGSALNALLNTPVGLTTDSAGDLYIADSNNHVIRMVSAAGIITTIAGNGVPAFSGDGGPAIYAQLNYPRGVYYIAGTLYIADTANSAIRTIDSTGTIATITGNGYASYSGDGDKFNAAAAQINNPTDVIVDTSGSVFIADTGNQVIREITKSDGYIHTFGGNGANNPGDGGYANDATLVDPSSLALDNAGSILIAEPKQNRIRKVSPKGFISTYAGITGSAGFSGDGGSASKANLWYPSGIFGDSSGNIYIADQLNNRIRKVSSSGVISTFAGNGVLNYSGDGATAMAAQLYRPAGVAVDASGTLYISDQGNHRIRKITQDGVISTVAGNGTAGFAGDGGRATAAQLNGPAGLAVDPAGNLYIADVLNHRVRVVTADGNISTLAGSGTPGYAGDGSAATSAQLYAPRAVGVDGAGNVYIADYENCAIRRVSNGIISTVAGNGTEGYSGDGGPAIGAQLDGPQGVAVDSKGNLYIADAGNNAVRVVTSDGAINTLAGNGIAGHDGDGGPASQALLASPASVAVDSKGLLYIADSGTRIRRVSASGVIDTVAGSGSPGYSGDGGLAVNAQINGPLAIAFDAAGRLFLADAWNNAIRVLTTIP